MVIAVNRGLDLEEEVLFGDRDFGLDGRSGQRELDDLSFLRLTGLETLHLEELR